VRAATSMFLISLANILPRLASMTAFLCLVVAHLEWPLITYLRSSRERSSPVRSAPRRRGACDAHSLALPSLFARALIARSLRSSAPGRLRGSLTRSTFALRASAHRPFAPLLGAGAPAMLTHSLI